MHAIAIDTLPNFDTENPIEYCFLYNSVGIDTPYYLVYECARDYTSVPRGYAIVRFVSLDVDRVDLNICHQYPCFSYRDAGDCEQKGLFVLQDSPELYQRDQTHFFMSMADVALEVICHRFELVKVVYHCHNPQDAMFEFIRSLPAPGS